MATSGTATFNLQFDDIIEEAGQSRSEFLPEGRGHKLNAPGRSRQGAKYDFSLMSVGDSVVLPMTQPQVWSRVQSWRNAKTHRERHSWEFATRKLNETETRLWRTK